MRHRAPPSPMHIASFVFLPVIISCCCHSIYLRFDKFEFNPTPTHTISLSFIHQSQILYTPTQYSSLDPSDIQQKSNSLFALFEPENIIYIDYGADRTDRIKQESVRTIRQQRKKIDGTTIEADSYDTVTVITKNNNVWRFDFFLLYLQYYYIYSSTSSYIKYKYR